MVRCQINGERVERSRSLSLVQEVSMADDGLAVDLYYR